jgi:hypothetical protein
MKLKANCGVGAQKTEKMHVFIIICTNDSQKSNSHSKSNVSLETIQIEIISLTVMKINHLPKVIKFLSIVVIRFKILRIMINFVLMKEIMIEICVFLKILERIISILLKVVIKIISHLISEVGIKDQIFVMIEIVVIREVMFMKAFIERGLGWNVMMGVLKSAGNLRKK